MQVIFFQIIGGADFIFSMNICYKRIVDSRLPVVDLDFTIGNFYPTEQKLNFLHLKR
jgi:hypothetical protein